MLTFKVTEDKLHLELIDFQNKFEVYDLKLFFKKRRDGYFHDPMYKRKLWDGYDRFYDDKTKLIGIGLWNELLKFSKKNECKIKINGLDSLLNLDFTKDQIDKFSSVLLDGVILDNGKPLIPYSYQLDAAYKGLKYKFSSMELATSAGKTLIFFIYLSFLKRKGLIDKNNKAILIVPKVSLVKQTVDAFNNEYQTGLIPWNIMQIGGGKSFKQELFDDCELLITTYQSVIMDKSKKRKKKNDIKTITRWAKPEFFENFRVVCIDEAHTGKGDSIRNILKASTNAEYKLGLSGTIKIGEQFSDFYKIQEYLGPLTKTVSAKYLIDNNYSVDVFIEQIKLKYPSTEPFIKKYKDLTDSKSVPGGDLYNIEKSFILGYEPRIKFITKLANGLPGNKLILFNNVKDLYGKRIQESILPNNENVYYIDGEVETSDRNEYQSIMENNSNIVLVASFGTFATGINLKNVNYIIFAESFKSEITIRQAIGRGMRNLTGKTKVVILDLVDDLDGYMIKHGKERESIYKKQKFPISKRKYLLS